MLVRTRANESFNRLYAERYLPGVRQVRSFMVLREILSAHALPVQHRRARCFVSLSLL
ncbi:hypothetical protein KGP95_01730 [Burkholderia multivorans]|nr:hypothetical protein [Burkholderia multivorans]MCO8609295.1 hypothetical protein [Burkholderia multivorans]MCO8630815.1 hypothetical protein [Burkholderia multivorans]MCO8636065.1 hypothetical protein [Burkholderia multivorans]MCO8647993.1 hypothetical protein [Burkholderia multivorans]